MKSSLRLLASVILVLSFLSELMTIIGSWICSSLMTDDYVQSLLTPEGIRWYIGSYADVLATPFIVWVILCGCAYGIFCDSGVIDAMLRLLRKQKTEYIKRISLQAAAIVAFVVVVAVSLLVMGPHAILLSATGTIIGSSFLSGAIPLGAFLFAAMGITYGYFSSQFRGITVLVDSCLRGVTLLVPILVLYVFMAHLYMTIDYVIK